MLNKRGPSVGPPGTPESTEKAEENFPKIRTVEDVFDK